MHGIFSDAHHFMTIWFIMLKCDIIIAGSNYMRHLCVPHTESMWFSTIYLVSRRLYLLNYNNYWPKLSID